MRDIPIERAILLWRPGGYDGKTDCGECAIVEAGTHDERLHDRFRFPMSVGAVFAYWKELNTMKRVLLLYIEIVHLIFRDHVPVNKVVNACFCIPEFRDTLSDDTIFEIHEMLGDATHAR